MNLIQTVNLIQYKDLIQFKSISVCIVKHQVMLDQEQGKDSQDMWWRCSGGLFRATEMSHPLVSLPVSSRFIFSCDLTRQVWCLVRKVLVGGFVGSLFSHFFLRNSFICDKEFPVRQMKIRLSSLRVFLLLVPLVASSKLRIEECPGFHSGEMISKIWQEELLLEET